MHNVKRKSSVGLSILELLKLQAPNLAFIDDNSVDTLTRYILVLYNFLID